VNRFRGESCSFFADRDAERTERGVEVSEAFGECGGIAERVAAADCAGNDELTHVDARSKG
jgi:hypothetical protein